MSCPARSGRCRSLPMTMKRVVFAGWSSMPSSTMGSPWISEARRLPIAAGLPVLKGLQHGRRGALRLDGDRPGKILPQPLPALGQGLGMGVDLPDPPLCPRGHQAVGDAKEELPPDRKRRCDQPLEGDPHGPLHRVFQRDDTEVGLLFLHDVEDRSDRFLRRHAGAFSEAIEGRQVATSPPAPGRLARGAWSARDDDRISR